MTADDRSLNGRIGNAIRWSRTTSEDRRKATEPARQAWAKRWEREADPEGVMSEADRITAADHLKQVHMLRMSLAAKSKKRAEAKVAAQKQARRKGT